MSTGRLEAFSDGVIAVAITLLVLNLPIPSGPSVRLAHDLVSHWAQFAAYAVSFVTIGIVWINHHSMIARLARGNHRILMLNLLLLMTIGLLPFATGVLATYLGHGGARPADKHIAALVYAGALLLMALAFSLLNWTILIRSPELLDPPLGEAERRRIFARAASGILPYPAAVALAPFSPDATLAICAAVAGFYALPIASGR
jgi:uncharacterized membrane protein